MFYAWCQQQLACLFLIVKQKLIIRDFTDVESLIREDEEKYNRKYNEIPETLKRDFYAFSETRMSTLLYRNNIKNDLSDFLAMYPQYNNIKDIQNIKMLSDNPVAELVSGYFRKKGFKLSLMFFNHSLVDNPSDIKIDLIDKNYGIESYIKSLLKEYDFFDKMKNFSNKNNEYETLSDSYYAFENGDLALAIHGFTWKRTRAKYSKAYFKIIDTYDFDPKSLPGKVAGLAGTNDYDIEIYGLVQNNSFR